jgi:hypothetical protein
MFVVAFERGRFDFELQSDAWTGGVADVRGERGLVGVDLVCRLAYREVAFARW